uniref:RNA-directed DNA polymerase n=1 Tax=Strigamia maritima TaxID=126957 RepID=T1JKJ3_STRMM
MEEFEQAQRDDENLSKIMNWLQTDPEDDTPWPDVPMEYTKLKTEFTLNRDGVLFIFAPFKSDIYLEDVDNSAGLKIVLPKSLQDKCLALVHDYSSSGHGGGDVTFERLRRSFFWVNCRQDTVKYVAKCNRCQRCKPIQRKLKGLLQPISAQIGRFERIGLDLMGSKPMTTNRNKFILIIVDYATGWVEVIPLRNAKILTLVPHIMRFFQTMVFHVILYQIMANNLFPMYTMRYVRMLESFQIGPPHTILKLTIWKGLTETLK